MFCFFFVRWFYVFSQRSMIQLFRGSGERKEKERRMYGAGYDGWWMATLFPPFHSYSDHWNYTMNSLCAAKGAAIYWKKEVVQPTHALAHSYTSYVQCTHMHSVSLHRDILIAKKTSTTLWYRLLHRFLGSCIPSNVAHKTDKSKLNGMNKLKTLLFVIFHFCLSSSSSICPSLCVFVFCFRYFMLLFSLFVCLFIYEYVRLVHVWCAPYYWRSIQRYAHTHNRTRINMHSWTRIGAFFLVA